MKPIINQWKFPNVQSLEDFRDKMNKTGVVKRSVNDKDWEDAPLETCFYDIENIKRNQIFKVEIDEQEVRYLVFGVCTERKKSKSNWFSPSGNLVDRVDRTTKYNRECLVFEINEKITVVSFEGKSDVEKIFSDLFNSDIWGVYSHVHLTLEEDMFYWLLKRVRDYNKKPLSTLYPDFKLEGLSGIMGKTHDSDIRASGSRVMAVLGTIAYIFSSDKIKSLTPEFFYKGHRFIVELQLNVREKDSGTFKIEEDNCMLILQCCDSNHKRYHVTLYCVLCILPMLLKCYEQAIENNIWNEVFKIDFLESLGAEIKERVEEELDSLREIGE